MTKELLTDKFKELIAKAVTENIVFNGGVGTNYNIQSLLATLKPASIEAIFDVFDTKLTKLGKRKLSGDTPSAKLERESLEFITDILSEAYTYKTAVLKVARLDAKAKADAEKKRLEAEAKADNANTLAKLKGVKDEIEIRKLLNSNPEDVEKEIATLEAAGFSE